MKWAKKLAEGTLEALRCFLQLAFESVNLLRYVIELFSSQRSRFRNLLDFAIRFAHCRSNSYRNSREPAFSCHRRPP